MPSGGVTPSGGGGSGLPLTGGTLTGALVIAPGDPNAIPLQIRAPLSPQNVDFFSVYDTGGSTDMLYLDDFGNLRTSGSATVAGEIRSPTQRIVAAGGVLQTITSGALPTVSPVSATGFQCSTGHDVFLVVAVTYNPGVATTATCKVDLSPDDVTYSTLVTITKPVGTVFDGSIDAVALVVPRSWYVKLTVTNATLGTGTYY